MPPSKNAKHRLIVEGKDDKWAVINLLKLHGVDWDHPSEEIPFVAETDSVNTMLAKESVSVALKNYSRVGWVLDADVRPTDRWTSIRNLLNDNGLSVPDMPNPNGTVVDGLQSDGRVGVWLMPDNRSPGILEDFLAKLVPPADPCWSIAEDATEEALQLKTGIEEKDRAKGIIHGWLAWQKEPGLPFGTALTARILRHDSPEGNGFAAWFKRLFIS